MKYLCCSHTYLWFRCKNIILICNSIIRTRTKETVRCTINCNPGLKVSPESLNTIATVSEISCVFLWMKSRLFFILSFFIIDYLSRFTRKRESEKIGRQNQHSTLDTMTEPKKHESSSKNEIKKRIKQLMFRVFIFVIITLMCACVRVWVWNVGRREEQRHVCLCINTHRWK